MIINDERIRSLHLNENERVLCFEDSNDNVMVITNYNDKYYFKMSYYDELIIRELDAGESFEIDKIYKWVMVTNELSNRKRKMRVPTISVMRAVGFDSCDIDLFLDNESKNGLVGRLRQMDWYKNAHPEIKTAVLKLFAHLGLFEYTNIDDRLKKVDIIINNFSLLEIHNYFGGLQAGTKLIKILETEDYKYGITLFDRRRFDPNGDKSISFFFDNIDNNDFKNISNYALTHFVYECKNLDLERQNIVHTIESMAVKSNNDSIVDISKKINEMHNLLADTIYLDERDKIEEMQSKMEYLRGNLYELINNSDDRELKDLLLKLKSLPTKVDINYFEKALKDVSFPNAKYKEIADAAIKAGYRNGDNLEVDKLCTIYSFGKREKSKYFSKIYDKSNSKYKYEWLDGSNPLLYTIAMQCGATCMRPGYAGEAALWESALSKDVYVCAIRDSDYNVIAYFRINYDIKNRGIYIDTVESRREFVLNNDDVWETVKRAVIDMANKMNEDGKYFVNVINYREERGNRLKRQWEELPVSNILLEGRAYHHKSAPWNYGDNVPRIQKKIWSVINKMDIEVDNIIDKGSSGVIYKLDDNRVLKLFPSDYSIYKVLTEYNNGLIFCKNNILSPKIYEIVKVKDCYGIIMEYINGKSLTKVINDNPDKLDYYMKKMIKLINKIHSVKVNDSNLKNMKDKYIGYLNECKDYYTKSELKKIEEVINNIPDTNTLLHGDLHTGNILVDSNDNLVIIDFAELGIGHPIFDIMAQGAVIPITVENDPSLAELYHNTSILLLNKIWNSYLVNYFNTDDIDKYDHLIRLYSRVRNAITLAIAKDVPEDYLKLCAKLTREKLLPYTDKMDVKYIFGGYYE